MATKSDKYPFVEQSFAISENQYNNLNLNQSEKCSTSIFVQSNSKPNNDKNYGLKNCCCTTNFTVSDNYKEKAKLQSFNKSLKISTFKTFNEDNEDLKKRWKNENTLKTTNKSTLSFHIEAYKNPIASDLFGNENIAELKKEKFGSIKPSKKCLNGALKSQNPFEFPRQGDHRNKPEVMRFKASQQLFGPTSKARTPEIVQEFPERGLRLYGSRLPRCDQTLVKIIESCKLQTFAVGTIFKGSQRQFRIEKCIGPRTYRVKDVGTKAKFFLKLEAIGMPKAAPSLKRDVLVLNNAFASSAKHRKHFLPYFDHGIIPNQFGFTIVPLCDCNLSDLRFTRLNGADFSRPTALNIASQTLQGIHDVQFNHYFHRDIRSGNFVVGLNDHHHIIYIINFSLSYEYYQRALRIEKGKIPSACDTPRITPKLPWISCRFQSRAFHLGREIHRLDDIESWLFLLIDTFDQKALPWKKAKCERMGYEQKERLFMGDYRESLGDLKPYIDIMMKYLEHCRARTGSTVDFPFYGNILEQMAQDWKITGKEPLDWMPDSSGYRNVPRAEGAAPPIKAKKSKHKTTLATKNLKQAENSSTPALFDPPPPPEDDFNFLPVILPDPIKPKENAEIILPESSTTNVDTTKLAKEKQPSPADGSGKNENGNNNNKVETTDKKDVNAIRKSSTNRRKSRISAAKKSMDESETKKKDKEKEKEKEKDKEKEKEKDKEEESDPNNKSAKEDKKENDDSKDESEKSN